MVISARDKKKKRERETGSRKYLGSWRSVTGLLDSIAREGLSEKMKVLKERRV